jgi:pimeloyl-ACP methyl ester carboxylesterase
VAPNFSGEATVKLIAGTFESATAVNGIPSASQFKVLPNSFDAVIAVAPVSDAPTFTVPVLNSSWNQFEATAQQAWVRAANTLPLVVSGFSFGSFVGTHLVQRLAELGRPAERFVMVGSAAGKWELSPVPADTILIHGEVDETIPLIDVLDWARPQDIPVIVIPGADHFFHRKLHHIKQLIIQLWHR